MSCSRRDTQHPLLGRADQARQVTPQSPRFPGREPSGRGLGSRFACTSPLTQLREANRTVRQPLHGNASAARVHRAAGENRQAVLRGGSGSHPRASVPKPRMSLCDFQGSVQGVVVRRVAGRVVLDVEREARRNPVEQLGHDSLHGVLVDIFIIS